MFDLLDRAGKLLDAGQTSRDKNLALIGILNGLSGRACVAKGHWEGAKTHYTLVLSECPPGHPDRRTTLLNLGHALTHLTIPRRSSRVSAAAIEHLTEALGLKPIGPEQQQCLEDLSEAHFSRYWSPWEVRETHWEDLDDAIMYRSRALRLGDLHRSENIGDRLYEEAATSLQLETLNSNPSASAQVILEKVVRCLLEVIRLPGHSCRTRSLLLIASAHRHQGKNDPAILEEHRDVAIKYAHQALQEEPSALNDRDLAELADDLQSRFEESSVLVDLDQAIEVRSKVTGVNEDAATLLKLGTAYYTRFELFSGASDFSDAIRCLKEAFEFAQSYPSTDNLENECDPLQCISKLIQAHSLRFQQTRVEAHRLSVIKYANAALSNQSRQDNQITEPLVRRQIKGHLARALWAGADSRNPPSNLPEIISHLAEALLDPLGPTDATGIQCDLVQAHWSRFRQTNSPRNLTEAIQYGEIVVKQLAIDTPEHLTIITTLAKALWERSKRNRSMKDLEAVLKYRCEALSCCPAGHPERSEVLVGLGVAQWLWFKQVGGASNLRCSISNLTEALSLRPQGQPERVIALMGLATSLNSWSIAYHGPFELDEAVYHYAEALSLLPRSRQDRPHVLKDFAGALLARWKTSGRSEDLNDAIKYQNETIQFAPEATATSISRLADLLEIRVRQEGSLPDAHKAVTGRRHVLRMYPQGHPDRWSALANLSHALGLRYALTGDDTDLNESNVCRCEVLSLNPLAQLPPQIIHKAAYLRNDAQRSHHSQVLSGLSATMTRYRVPVDEESSDSEEEPSDPCGLSPTSSIASM